MPNPVRFTEGSFLFDLIRPSYLQQPRNDSFFVLDADDAAITIVAELELELIQTQMAQKPMLRAEVGMRVRCANKASAE